ncbi:tetratricopeptide repeat protein [Secundilactobacillus malefermentans]|uniref:Uncharacterized protein n=1 Tax=Secundilactobacillus malefermentans TaxID=176292 RepID=A0A4R5NKF5_9LACO|nr:tetratricopeptide repeat protein [Secundilactobacillus malefermentans]KRM60092.1 hypothetical protein FD44_GL000654 [Secundilactobacillus malefermentans DSM 5705 = KCTC 3548]TDG75105.1 hypothetical protein C5L31_000982 [Secundilactobacillus malefermentans]
MTDKKVNRKDEKKQTEELLKKLVAKVDANPADYHAYYNLGAMLTQVKSYAQAEELFLKAQGLLKNQTREATDELTYGLANVYYESGKFDQAIHEFTKIKSDKLQKDTYLMISQCYIGLGNHKQALAYALTAQNLAKQDSSANRLVAENLLALGNFDEAAQYFDIILENDPEDGAANFDRGLLAMVLSQPFDDYFKKAKKNDPTYFKKQQNKLVGIEELIKARKN